MLEVPQECEICRHDDNLGELKGDHGDKCDNYVGEDEEGAKLDEPKCDVDDESCVVGKVKLDWVGDPLPSEG